MTGENDNICFLYIPFSLKNTKPKEIIKALHDFEISDIWNPKQYRTKKFYKYVSDKLFETEKKCVTYTVEKSYSNYSYLFNSDIYIKETNSVGAINCQTTCFHIDNILMVSYKKPVWFIIFQLHFCDDQLYPQKIANTIYFLKKPYHTELLGVKDKINRLFNLFEIAQELLKSTLSVSFQLFFYMEEKYARANYLIMLKVDLNIGEKELIHILYYLKHGFSDKYIRTKISTELDDYYGPNGRIWGITSESVVNIVRDSGMEDVLKKQFDEFQSEYFIMFSLLLFQKYTYFYLLTSLTYLDRRDNKQLKQYKEFLADFERDYVFSVVTDIPQYKTVYERMVETFDLEKLYVDIYEPVLELNNRQKMKQENRISAFGFILSILGLFSIVVDGKQIIDMISSNTSIIQEDVHKVMICLHKYSMVFILVLILLLYLIKKVKNKR